ncbi:MAG: FecCD family ABC transporter permease [Bauldia sp.]
MTIAAGIATRSGDRRSAARLAILLLAAGLLSAVVASLSVGPSAIALGDLLGAVRYWLAGAGVEPAPATRTILIDIRLPRMAMGVLVGMLLAVAGTILQGLFRNPLADPGLIGISSGASLGAVLSIVLGGGVLASMLSPFGVYQLPALAFAGSLVVTLILYAVSTRGGRTSVPTMLLAGIALAAIAAALMGILIYMSDDRQLRDITFWSLGSLSGATWQKIGALAPLALLVTIIAALIANGLNAIMLGEAEAGHLGIPVQRLKRLAIVAVAAAVGAAVAFSGTIGFVGLIVPHLLRLAIGPDHRFLLPAAGLAGAILILLADLVSRMVVAPAELPIGIVMALLGGPFFLWLLLRRRAILDV